MGGVGAIGTMEMMAAVETIGDDWRRLEAIGDELQRGTPLRESSLGCGRGRLEFGGRDTYLMSCGVVEFPYGYEARREKGISLEIPHF